MPYRFPGLCPIQVRLKRVGRIKEVGGFDFVFRQEVRRFNFAVVTYVPIAWPFVAILAQNGLKVRLYFYASSGKEFVDSEGVAIEIALCRLNKLKYSKHVGLKH